MCLTFTKVLSLYYMKNRNTTIQGEKMKSLVFFGIIYILLLPLLAIGCDKSTPSDTTIPTTPAFTLNYTLDNFTDENNIVKNVEVSPSGTFIVKLGSNPSTGFSWGDAEISAKDVIAQGSSEFIKPTDTSIVGAPGTDVRIFKAIKAGTATIKFSYSRPWEGGEPDEYTLTINVTVK